MCGIVGVASVRGWLEPPLLAAMRDAMRHRGPDDAGEWWSRDRRVGLGHRRLSILDLSPAGHQPMVACDGELALVLNGEIYNFSVLRAELSALGHQFRSQSDTEVILEAYRAWGPACIERLRGMFAFGLCDTRQRRLILARDRAGEKPLFYAAAGGQLRFASELKALLVDPSQPRVLNVASLDAYLAFGYVPGESCLIEGIAKLAPGCVATFDLETGHLATSRYWALPRPPSGPRPDEGELLKELELLLEASVREQLVADVPVGVLLSGGVDSSLVVAMAARASSTPVRTFTITFPGHGSLNEGPYARLVAEHFGTDHHELIAEPASLDLLPALVHQYDEPIADSSMLPTFLVSRLVRSRCTVALGGDGGDELFGGYTLYQVAMAQRALSRWLPGLLRQAIGKAAGWLPVGFRGRTYLQTLGLDSLEAVAQTGLYFDQSTRAALCPLVRGPGSQGRGESYRRFAATGVDTTVQRLTRADFASYLCDDILVKVDRASMLSSLEVRAPFLDQRIIEFAFGRVPDDLRTTLRGRKILLRRLARRLLPPALDIDRKQGFSIPLAAWFRGDWGRYLQEVLRGAPPELLNGAAVDRLISGQRRGLNNGQRLFSLVMLELWRREYGIEIPNVHAAAVGE